jgi:uncharacterized lipoprotein
MRQLQLHGFNVPRLLMITTMIVATSGLTGCHWFRKNSAYQMPPESRPLEVPPDLDRPDTQGAMQIPEVGTQSVTRSSLSSAPQPANTTSGFIVKGDRTAVFNQVGTALAGVQGLTIASTAQLLGTYDVSYQGSNFLVRVTQTDAGISVSAVDPRGLPASSPAATQLIATLKSQLGGS